MPLVQTGANPDGQALPSNVFGILGIAFDDDSESNVERDIQNAWGQETTLGRTVLSNLFAQNSSLGTFFDLAIGRASDLEEADFDGTVIIGEHPDAFAAVAQQPKIYQESRGQWAGFIDGFMVNGQNISAQSGIDGVPAGQLLALFDSGTSAADVPAAVANAIYQAIPGSISVNDTWYVPCYSSANVTVVIGYVVICRDGRWLVI